MLWLAVPPVVASVTVKVSVVLPAAVVVNGDKVNSKLALLNVAQLGKPLTA